MAPAELDQAVKFGPFRLYARHRKLFCASEEVHLRGRAMDVLLALARTKGDLVPKAALFESAWPHVLVHESNLKVTVAALRRVLRAHDPSHDYIRTVSGRGYWLSTDVELEKRPEVADLPVTSAPPLPQLGTVIGRDADIASLYETLTRDRLTTIVGAGGIGKTTVAVAVAHLIQDEEDCPVTFLDLARIASGEFVAASVASALGITSDSDDSLQAIASILARRKVLLLLDTCEHVLSAVTHLCNVLIARTSDVRVLATSRQVLGAQAEKVVWLAALDVPPQDHAGTVADVLRYSAPQLLAARALEKVGYRPAHADAPAIAAICRRLDGAPLAIELVASRLAGRSPDLVLEDLDDRFRTLAQASPGGPLRQQTLQATLEWSYGLLTQHEATALRALSIFAGSFDTDSGVRVIVQPGLDPSDAFDAIAGLRAKSMLSVEKTSGELRHRLLDSTRAFAADLLETRGEWSETSARHAQLQLKVLTHVASELATTPAYARRASYFGYVDDLRKALDWALDRSGDLQLGMHLVVAGLPLWRELSLAEESRQWCGRALVLFERTGCSDTTLKLELVIGHATSNTYLSGEPAETIVSFEAALQLARETAEHGSECRVLGALATYQLLPGHQRGVAETLQAMRRAAIRADDRTALWEQGLLDAVWCVHRCEFSAAQTRLQSLREEMRAHSEDAGPRFHIHQKINVEVQMGALHWLMGQPGRAQQVIENAAREAMELSHGLTLIHCLSRGIIWTMNECHEYAKARVYTEALKSAIYRHGIAAWLPIANCYSESIDALSGVRASPEGLREAFDGMRRAAVQLSNHTYFATLAQAMIARGQVDDAARTLDHVLQVEQRLFTPELLRLRAATERAFGRDHDAEATLRESLRVAAEIRCPAWELRSGLDLAALLRDQGAPAEALQVLAPRYDCFRDGLHSGDLRMSRALLERLRSSREARG